MASFFVGERLGVLPWLPFLFFAFFRFSLVSILNICYSALMSDNENKSESSEATFGALGVSEKYTEKLEAINIKAPTAVQSRIIPLLSNEKSVIFKSETGTGKTFAFLLPILAQIENIEGNGSVKALIFSPTYELSSQIKAQLQKISSIKSALIIGASPIKRQIETLKEKPEVVIGSVGRILELIRLKKLKTSAVKIVVLDEIDRLFDRELRDDTKEVLSLLSKNENLQFIGCSATANSKICESAKKMSGLEIGFEALPEENILSRKIEHWAIFAERRDKIDTLRSFINAVSAKKSAKIIVFTSRGDQVENIARKLTFKKIKCVSLYAKMGKLERKNAVDAFRSGKSNVLVTSDVFARGLDICGVTHVVQLDLNEDDAYFTHRAGRTARQGESGVNVVIGDEREMRDYASLEKRLKIVVHPKMLFRGEVVEPREL